MTSLVTSLMSMPVTVCHQRVSGVNWCIVDMLVGAVELRVTGSDGRMVDGGAFFWTMISDTKSAICKKN